MSGEPQNKYWNSRVRNITPYTAGEQPQDRQFIKLNTNENPYPPAPAVFEALQHLDVEALRLYPDPACTMLRDAIAAHHGVRREEVFTGNGSDEILAFAFAAFFESGGGKPVLFPDITYSFYPVYAALWDIPYNEVPLTADWRLRARDYERPSGGIVIANPNAPTGLLASEETLQALGDAAARQKAVMIIDEAYSAFSGAQAAGLRGENILSVYTYSKAYSLAGLRAGYAIGHAPLITALEHIRDSFNSYTVDRVAQMVAAAAIKDRAYFEKTCTAIIATRERVSAALRARAYTVLPSAANFILVRHPQGEGAAFFSYLRERGILVRHFTKTRIKDFLRISMGTDRDMDTLLSVL